MDAAGWCARPSAAVVVADPPAPPGWFPRSGYSNTVEWLSARHRESAIGSDAVAPDPEHPDQAGWHLATPQWYPSDLVRPKYKSTAKYQRLAIGANYEGTFALQLIMEAAPPHTVFVWAVKVADDGCRYALQDTVVGKGHWNQVACSARLFPHGAAETRKWTDPNNFIALTLSRMSREFGRTKPSRYGLSTGAT